MSEIRGEFTPPPAKRPFIIENLDPSDVLPRLLLPNMVKEHIARYEFAKRHCPELTDQNVNILDIASGRGYGSAILKKEFPKATVTGVEFREKYVAQAQKKYGGNGEGPKFLQGDARRTPAGDSSVDIVTAFEIAEHLPRKDQSAFFQEIARVLKPGGVAFISFPHRYSFETNKNNETVRIPVGSNPYHLHEPLPNEVDQYVSDAKLEIAGKFGQIMVSEKNASRAKRLNRIVPMWPIFAWTPKRDVSLVNIPEGKVGVTNIYVVKKLSSSNAAKL